MPLLRTETEGRVMTVVLDDPPANFMTGPMVDELDALVTAVDHDPAIGAVILTGAPEGIFISHYDVAEIVAGAESVGASVGPRAARGALRAVGAAARVPGARGALGATPASGLVELRQVHDVFLRMNRSSTIFIAAINGNATGGGCELALACDLRIMAEGDFRIGLPEISVGIIPGAGGTQRLVRALGPARALELMLEAEPLKPKAARRLGLVHRTCPPEALMADARATAERLARRSPAAVGALKRAVYDGGSQRLAAGLHTERAEFLAIASSGAALRGMHAYAEQVAASGSPPVVPWTDAAAGAPWFDGTAVDLSE
jgi:enoyl-CoA hydratase/carnithine racemase